MVIHQPTSPEEVINAAFLVDRIHVRKFEDAVEDLGREFAGRVTAAAARSAGALRLRPRGVRPVGLLLGLIGLPLAPVRGVLWLAEHVRDQAEQQYYDPARIRAQLERIEDARRSGELPEDECEDLENELLQRLMSRPESPQWMEHRGT